MIRSATFLLATTLCLSACAEFRGIPSLDVKLPEVFSQAPAIAASQKPAPLSQDWWKQTDDKMLVGLLERVEKQNLSIEQATLPLARSA